MSRTITNWKCDNCKSEFHNYVSFGHPEHGFDHEWRCIKCGHINTIHIYGEFEVMQRLKR